jgi:hypothetical protein
MYQSRQGFSFHFGIFPVSHGECRARLCERQIFSLRRQHRQFGRSRSFDSRVHCPAAPGRLRGAGGKAVASVAEAVSPRSGKRPATGRCDADSPKRQPAFGEFAAARHQANPHYNVRCPLAGLPQVAWCVARPRVEPTISLDHANEITWARRQLAALVLGARQGVRFTEIESSSFEQDTGPRPGGARSA